MPRMREDEIFTMDPKATMAIAEDYDDDDNEEFIEAEEELDTTGYDDSVQGLNSISLESPHSPSDLSQREILKPKSTDTVQASATRQYFVNLFTKLIEWKPGNGLSNTIAYFLMPIFVWLVTFLLVGPNALPNGSIFPLVVLEFCGLGLGMCVAKMQLPPLLGMLAMGILIRNVPFIDFGKNLTSSISAPLRQIALVIILIRAGLGLDPEALMRLKGTVVRLAFCPCICEAVTVAVASHILLGLPWAWGFLLGFVLGAVSPAVVVPCLLSLKEKGLGVEKGIPTIIIAAASIDDILAISLFGVALGVALARGSLVTQLIQGPIELILGIVFGIIWGLIMGLIFVRNDKDTRSRVVVRAFFLFTGGIISIFGFQFLDYPGAGALCCLCSTVVCTAIWRKKKLLTEGDGLSWTFAFFWFLFQPLLFGLIGCELDLISMEWRVVGLGILCLCIGLTVRLIASYLAVANCNSSLNVSERIFIAIAWLPKATVQAAIGSVALDTARKIGAGNEPEELGLTVLTVAVLSILLTAPLGAAAITLSGPRLLQKLEKSGTGNRNLNNFSSNHI